MITQIVETRIESPELFRVIAASPSKPDDVVLIDSTGKYRLFIGSTGTVSRGSLNPGLVTALLERDHWNRVTADRQVTLDELREVAAGRNRHGSIWNWVEANFVARLKR